MAISSALAFGVSCGAESFVRLFAFDLDRGYIYFGKKEAPSEIIKLNDERLNQYLAISLDDWRKVKERLATCQSN